jgi:hypothetical protein
MSVPRRAHCRSRVDATLSPDALLTYASDESREPHSLASRVPLPQPGSGRASGGLQISPAALCCGSVDHQSGGPGVSSSGVVVRGDDQPLRVSADKHLLAEFSDPDGRPVVLLARIWEDKITRDHPELRTHLEHVVATVTEPDHAEPDPRARRRRYYRRRVGPSRWLLVVVSFEQQPGRIITAVATRKDPKRWKP